MGTTAEELAASSSISSSTKTWVLPGQNLLGVRSNVALLRVVTRMSTESVRVMTSMPTRNAVLPNTAFCKQHLYTGRSWHDHPCSGIPRWSQAFTHPGAAAASPPHIHT